MKYYFGIDPKFVTRDRDDLVPGKIHCIHHGSGNVYEYWKMFEGCELEMVSWKEESDGRITRLKTICIKPLVYVQKVTLFHRVTKEGYKMPPEFFTENGKIPEETLAENDGFDSEKEFTDWYFDYPDGQVAILHFTEFWY
jgi:hypothetical protein